LFFREVPQHLVLEGTYFLRNLVVKHLFLWWESL